MLKKCMLIGALAALLPTAALAARTATGVSPEITSIGPRVGFSVDPDQLVVGGQMSVGGFAPEWTFDPSLELGFGDSQTDIMVNLDANYHFVLRDSDWRPYVGGGVGIDFISVDLPFPLQNESATNVGLNVILGTTVPTSSGHHILAELRLGLGDIPTLKGIIGWNFKL